jgi:ABC-type thiamine transport system ATPase subunit
MPSSCCGDNRVRYNGSVLKKIRLKNFKLHEDTTIEAGRITVFIGPNNSGKSSIFQALLALKQAMPRNSNLLLTSSHREVADQTTPFLFPAEVVTDPGDFGDILRLGCVELCLGLEAELPAEHTSDEAVRRAGRISVSFDVWVRENRLVKSSGGTSCSFGEVKWGWQEGSPAGGALVRLPVGDGGAVSLNYRPTGHFDLLAPLAISGAAPQNLSFARLHRTLAGAPAEAVRSSWYISPLRGFEEWGYPTTENPAGENLGRLVLPDRSVALTNLLAGNARLRAEVSERLGSLVGLGMEFETATLHRVKIWATPGERGTPETLFVNEGSGANQLPFILVPIALAREGETVLLAEPEAHLHPKMQSELTGTLLRAAKERELQFFIETHSEHVLHRLLQAVAKDELAHDDLAIYYFENKQGKAEVRRLNIDEKGGVEGGLPGFFDQSLDELTEYLEALRQSKA